MSDCHSTRSRFPAGNPHYREHARASIALARQSPGAAPTPEQSVALERIAVRIHGRANRHDLGTWREDPAAPGGEFLACLHCGARAYLSRVTGAARVGEILEACK
jgi:hypothetical protein